MDFNTSVAPPSPAALDLKPPPQVQSPLDMAAQFQQLQAGRQQMQTQQLQQQELQMNLAQRQAINQAYQGAFTAGADGTSQLDTQKLTSALATAGHGEAIPQIMEGWTKYQQSLAGLKETKLKNDAAESDTAGKLAQTVQAANNDPALFHTALTDLINRGILEPGHYAPLDQMLQQSLQQDPSGQQARVLVGKFTDQMIAGSPKQQELANQKLTAQGANVRANAAQTEAANSTTRTNAELPGLQAKSDIEKASADALKNMTLNDWQNAVETTVPDKTSALYQRTAGAVKLALSRGDLKGAQAAIKDAGDQLGKTESAVATAKATAPIKIDVATATQAAGANAAASGGGLDLMAEQALNGSFSSRNPALMAKVYNRAAEMAQEQGMSNQQVLMQQKAAHSNQAALTGLTKQYETLKPFEDMALRNAAVLEQKSRDVADLGAPFLNTPLRQLQEKFMGNPKVTAFVAAMQPVQADFARILNSPTGAGVLSDDARHEMQAAISPGGTPAQIKSALDVFRNDARNRHDAYDAAVRDLQGRTVVGTAGGQPAATAPKFKVGDSVTYQGKPHKVTAVDPQTGKLTLEQ